MKQFMSWPNFLVLHMRDKCTFLRTTILVSNIRVGSLSFNILSNFAHEIFHIESSCLSKWQQREKLSHFLSTNRSAIISTSNFLLLYTTPGYNYSTNDNCGVIYHQGYTPFLPKIAFFLCFWSMCESETSKIYPCHPDLTYLLRKTV